MFRHLLCGLALTCPAVMQASAADPAGLTLKAAMSAVLTHNPEIAASVQQRTVADAETRIASAFPNPDLSLSSGRWQPRSGLPAASGSTQQVVLAQTVELPSVREARARAAGHGVAAAEAQVQSVRIDIGFEAQAAFFQLLRRQEEARLAVENVALLGDILNRVRARVEAGEAPRFELVRAEAELLSARTSADSAHLLVDEARGLLRRLAGNALPVQFDAVGTLSGPAALPEFGLMQGRVLDANPRLRILAAEHDRMRARLDHERALRTPQPTLSIAQAQDPETRQIQFGVALPLPLWNRRDGQIARAQAEIDLALTRIEAQRAQLLRELDAAYSRVRIAQRQVETFESGLLKGAEAALKVAEAAWRFGERSFLEVLDAQRTLRSVRREYSQARFDRQVALIEIRRLKAEDPFVER